MPDPSSLFWRPPSDLIQSTEDNFSPCNAAASFFVCNLEVFHQPSTQSWLKSDQNACTIIRVERLVHRACRETKTLFPSATAARNPERFHDLANGIRAKLRIKKRHNLAIDDVGWGAALKYLPRNQPCPFSFHANVGFGSPKAKTVAGRRRDSMTGKGAVRNVN